MNTYIAIYIAVLFFLLSPGVLFQFPSKEPIITLGVHAMIFSIILQLTYKMVYQQVYRKEGFEDNKILIGLCIFIGILFSIVVIGLIQRYYLLKND